MARRKTEVHPALDQHIQGYERASSGSVLSAGALAVLVAAAPLTYAEVVFTPTHQIISMQNGPALIDFNGDGIADVEISAGTLNCCGVHRIRPDSCSTSCSCGSESFLDVLALEKSDGVVVNAHGFAVRGQAGQIVRPEDPFGVSGNMAVANHGCVSYSRGPWKNRPGVGFLGAKFQIDGETHYGWIRLSHTSPKGGLMTGYAYETIPNKPIIAGATSDSEPESNMELPAGSLGSLAAGAAGR